MKKEKKKPSPANATSEPDIIIETYKPVCMFQKGSISPAFEKALEAVENMDKGTIH